MSQNTHTHTNTNTNMTSTRNAPTCGICGQPVNGPFHEHALAQSTNQSLPEEVRAKERKNYENLVAKYNAKMRRFQQNRNKAKEVSSFNSGGAAVKPSTAQVILAAIVAAFAAVSSVSYTDADAEEEAREFIARFGYPTNEYAIRGVVGAFNASVGAGGRKARLKQQRVQQFMTLSESGFPVNGPPDGERRPGPRKRVKNTPDEDRKIQTIEVYDFNEGKMVLKSGFVYETDFCIGSKVFPEFEDLYYAMIVTAFKCGMPPVMPFSGDEVFFSQESAVKHAEKRGANQCGNCKGLFIGPWHKHCERVGGDCLKALKSRNAKTQTAKTETPKAKAPSTKAANPFAGLVVEDDDIDVETVEVPEQAPAETRVCRFFNSPKGCRSGKSCPFVHQGKPIDDVLNRKVQHDTRMATQKAKKAKNATLAVAPAPKVQKKAIKQVVKAEPTLDEQIAALKAHAATLQAQKDAERKEREAAATKVAAQQRREAAEKAAKAAREAKERELAELQQMVQELQKSPEKTAKKCRKALKAIGKIEELKSQGKTLTEEQLAKVARKAEFEKDLAKATAPVEKQTDDEWGAGFPEPVNVAPASKWVAGAPKLSTGTNRLFAGFGA